jgi:hypothetical protein
MSDRVREAFEAHFRMLPYYCDHEVELAWIAWQASRAAALEEAAATVAAMIISPTDIILCADTIDEAAARIRALGAK